jgi:hypothetical protein
MIKYYKQEGSHWTTYYALDKDNGTVHAIEARYRDSAKGLIDTYVTASMSVSRGSYDLQAAQEISTYDALTAKEWGAIKKEVTDYIKTLEGQQ